MNSCWRLTVLKKQETCNLFPVLLQGGSNNQSTSMLEHRQSLGSKFWDSKKVKFDGLSEPEGYKLCKNHTHHETNLGPPWTKVQKHSKYRSSAFLQRRTSLSSGIFTHLMFPVSLSIKPLKTTNSSFNAYHVLVCGGWSLSHCARGGVHPGQVTNPSQHYHRDQQPFIRTCTHFWTYYNELSNGPGIKPLTCLSRACHVVGTELYS